MKIIIPDNIKEIKEIKKNIHMFCGYTYLISPFMYMNYNDAIRETFNIFKRHIKKQEQTNNNIMSIKEICIIDTTGLSVEILDSLKCILNNSDLALKNITIGHISLVEIEEHLKNKINRTLLCDFKNKVLTEMNFFVNSKQWINGFDTQENFEILEELSTGFYVTYPKVKYFYFIF